jgi:hypothetical protein
MSTTRATGLASWCGADLAGRSEGRALAAADRADALNEDRIAQAFHEAYERFAPLYGYKTREASAVPWASVPEDNKRLMRRTVADLLEKGVIRS